MIKANFNAYDSYVTDSLYQWDLNQVLTVTGLNLAVVPEIHFSNANMERAIVRQSAMVNHVVSVGIPNSLLQDPLTIEADIGIYEGNTFKVVEKVLIPVIPKKRPNDYQIQGSDEEIYSFKKLENMIEQIDEKWSAFTMATGDEAVNAWLTEHPEATTTVQDKSLTIDKMVIGTLGYVTPEMFGAVGDGVTDDTEAIDSAVAYCVEKNYPLVFLSGSYMISETIDMRYVDIDCRGTIIVKHSGVGIIVGDKSITTSKRAIKIKQINHYSYSDGDISVRIVGLANGNVNVDNAKYVQLYADGDSDYSSIAYSSFHIGKCDYLQIVDKADTTAIGWINENTFYNCRVMKAFSIIGNTYKHNNNVFYKPCFENATMTLSNCRRNKFYDLRNEGDISIALDENTEFNYIGINYFNHHLFSLFENLGITDNGIHNTIAYDALNALKNVIVYNANAVSISKNLYEIAMPEENISVDGDNVNVATKWQRFVNDAIIPVENIKFLVGKSDQEIFRFNVTPLDVDKNIMSNDPLTYVGIENQGSDGMYSSGIDVGYVVISIDNPDVKYVKISIMTGSSQTNFTFNNMSLIAYYEPLNYLTASKLADIFKTTIPK